MILFYNTQKIWTHLMNSQQVNQEIHRFVNNNLEARVILEEGKTEVNFYLDKVKNNIKFEELSKDFLKILTVKNYFVQF